MITATCALVASIIGKSLGSTAAPSAATQSQQSAFISSAASYGHRINSTNGGSVGQDIEFDNWSGAVLQTTGITEVSGTFEVPNVHPPANADASCHAAGCMLPVFLCFDSIQLWQTHWEAQRSSKL